MIAEATSAQATLAGWLLYPAPPFRFPWPRLAGRGKPNVSRQKLLDEACARGPGHLLIIPKITPLSSDSRPVKRQSAGARNPFYGPEHRNPVLLINLPGRRTGLKPTAA